MSDPASMIYAEEIDALGREMPADPEALARFQACGNRLRIPACTRTGQLREIEEFRAAIKGGLLENDDYARWLRVSYRALKLCVANGLFIPASHVGVPFDVGSAFDDLSEVEFVALCALRANWMVYCEWKEEYKEAKTPAPIWYAGRAKEMAAELGVRP